jgi:hypothetical protein
MSKRVVTRCHHRLTWDRDHGYCAVCARVTRERCAGCGDTFRDLRDHVRATGRGVVEWACGVLDLDEDFDGRVLR